MLPLLPTTKLPKVALKMPRSSCHTETQKLTSKRFQRTTAHAVGAVSTRCMHYTAVLQWQPILIPQQSPSLAGTQEHDHTSPAGAPTLCRGWNEEDDGMREKIATKHQQGTVHAFRQGGNKTVRQGFSAIKREINITGVVLSDSRREKGKRTSIVRLGRAQMSLRMSELCRHASMM